MSETNGQNGTAWSVESFALGGVSYAAACDNPLSERFTPGKAMTEGYRPGIIQNVFNPRMPLFSLGFIDWMLLDPTVQLGLRMIKGPIYTCKAFVESDPEAEKFTGPKLTIKSKDKQVAAFVASNINRFWQGSLRKVLSMVEYGTSAGEVTYRLNGDMLHFDELRDVKLFDARVLTDKENSRFLGVSINNIAQKGKVQIPHPKAWWSIHDRKYTRWYGQSRLYGAFAPWWEKTTEGGAIDVRRLWFYKNAYDSGTMRHPDGNSDVNGISTPNRDIARQYVEERRTGHVGVLPSTRYPPPEGGGYMWETDEPKLNGSAEDIRENVKDIDGEIYRGMGIPPEVVQSDGTGSYSGRLVPQSAFYSSLEDLLNDLLATLRERILDPLVVVNFGHIEYEIQTDPLAPDDSQQGPQLPPQAGGQGGQPPQQPGGAGGSGPGSWVPFAGARGGQGEKNTATGAVRYSHPHRTDNGELFAIRMSIVGPAAPDYDGPPDQPENKIPLVDRIIKEGLDAAFDAIAGLRLRLREELGPLVDAGHPPDFILFEARRIILEVEPELAQTLSDTLLASWVAGASEVAEDIPAEVLTEIQLTRVYHQIPPEPPEITTLLYPADEAPRIRFPLIENAAKSLAERQILSKEDFQTLSVEAKRQAFTVAGQDSIETVAKIRDVLTELVQEGPTLAKFHEALDAKVFGGESPMAPWHQEVVYRNNVQESYSAGLDRILNDPLVVDAFPYEADDSIRDARRSEICEWFATNGIDGTNIYRTDDPLYQKLRAPRHHNCRTGRRPMTIQMAADKGISEAKDWLESGRKPTNPFRMEMPPAKLLKGTFYGASGSQGMRFALADEDDAIKAIVAAFEAGELTIEEAVEAYQAILEDDVPDDSTSSATQRFAWNGPHEGPRGGVYWLNDESGNKRYRKTKPGTGRELWTEARRSLGVTSKKGLDAYRGARETHADALAGKITVDEAVSRFRSMLDKFETGTERAPTPPKKITAKLPNDKSVTFVPHEKAKESQYEMVEVDPAKLNAAWQANEDNYLPPDGQGKGKSEIAGRREGFKEFLAKGEPIQTSMVTVGEDGTIDFADGRHRARVLMDAGIDKLVVSVPKGQVGKFKEAVAKGDGKKEEKTVTDNPKEKESPAKSDPEPSIVKSKITNIDYDNLTITDNRSDGGSFDLLANQHGIKIQKMPIDYKISDRHWKFSSREEMDKFLQKEKEYRKKREGEILSQRAREAEQHQEEIRKKEEYRQRQNEIAKSIVGEPKKLKTPIHTDYDDKYIARPRSIEVMSWDEIKKKAPKQLQKFIPRQPGDGEEMVLVNLTQLGGKMYKGFKQNEYILSSTGDRPRIVVEAKPTLTRRLNGGPKNEQMLITRPASDSEVEEINKRSREESEKLSKDLKAMNPNEL